MKGFGEVEKVRCDTFKFEWNQFWHTEPIRFISSPSSYHKVEKTTETTTRRNLHCFAYILPLILLHSTPLHSTPIHPLSDACTHTHTLCLFPFASAYRILACSMCWHKHKVFAKRDWDSFSLILITKSFGLHSFYTVSNMFRFEFSSIKAAFYSVHINVYVWLCVDMQSMWWQIVIPFFAHTLQQKDKWRVQ